MSHNTLFKEGKRTHSLGPINNLIWHYEIAGLDFLAQRAHGTKCDDGSDADAAESSDVGAVGDFVGGELVVSTMAREEGDGGGVVGEDVDGEEG
ncbi:hypothetical protein H4I95_07457 [Botrytis cinerea]